MQVTETERSVFVHCSALVETDDVGEGTRVWAFAHVMGGAKVGKRCNICDHVFVESGAAIGDDVVVKNGVSIWDGVKVENKVLIAPGATFTNDKHPRTKAIVPDFVPELTVVKEGASIGANATILCGITIGEYAMVGAGAVVTRDVPAYGLVVGNPAILVEYVCKCAKTLEFVDDRARCVCGREYLNKYDRCRDIVIVTCTKE